jgi:hypothetical protein
VVAVAMPVRSQLSTELQVLITQRRQLHCNQHNLQVREYLLMLSLLLLKLVLRASLLFPSLLVGVDNSSLLLLKVVMFLN